MPAMVIRRKEKEQMPEVFKGWSDRTGDYSFENAHWIVSITTPY